MGITDVICLCNKLEVDVTNNGAEKQIIFRMLVLIKLNMQAGAFYE